MTTRVRKRSVLSLFSLSIPAVDWNIGSDGLYWDIDRGIDIDGYELDGRRLKVEIL